MKHVCAYMTLATYMTFYMRQYMAYILHIWPYMEIYDNIYDIGNIYDILYASIYDTYMSYMGMYGSYM